MRLKITIVLVLALMFALVQSCKKHELPGNNNESYSSTPVLPDEPYDYARSGDDNLPTLGRVLFYDKNLSLNGSVSCASCHQQSKAFCDNLQFSTGLFEGKTGRNTPSIFAKNGRMFWDGRSTSVHDLVLRPVKNHVEMNFEDLEQLAERLSKTSYYPALFQKAFGSTGIDSLKIKIALAAFVENFQFSGNKFKRSNLKQEDLSASEKIGKIIFFGRGNCSRCHHIDEPLFGGNGYGSTDHSFNIGLDKVYQDNGVGDISKNSEEIGSFMVPALLNVEFTGPYMHDGRFKTLEEVVEHYNSGIHDHENLDFRLRDLGSLNDLTDQQILQALDKNLNFKVDASEMSQYHAKKLELTTAEKKGLVDFLKTLSDHTIFTDKKFSDPFRKN